MMGTEPENDTHQDSGMDVRTFNIVALGDCNTCGVEGAAGQIVPDYVANGLRARGLDCVLVNLGLTMCTTREGLAKLRDHTGRIDLLLVNYGLVDAWTTSLPGLYLSYYPDHRVKIWARKLLKLFKRRLRSPWIRRWLPVGEVVSVTEYERNLRLMAEMALARSAETRIVFWGTAPVCDDLPRNRMIDRYNGIMRGVADTVPSVRYCDTPSILAGRPLAEMMLDGVHLNATASGQVAAGILALCPGESEPGCRLPVEQATRGAERREACRSDRSRPTSECPSQCLTLSQDAESVLPR